MENDIYKHSMQSVENLNRLSAKGWSRMLENIKLFLKKDIKPDTWGDTADCTKTCSYTIQEF